ncbi:V-type ATP synthase subunit D [Thiocapsa imhoffii]|uniref:V-type ATP synthase subunit D n=1 Tax=Thiocapsa imhoffii TaxID=382777 RepID=A0A9X1B954_9GAMM|nr:V-type ATP synthase subunit D [Thiocapsa imhoffii]MBK1645497.1 V-type ATP synthase subunit D [Thiocapsa imhoffii]
MSRVSLSKSSLAKQNRNLRTYERYLPSLDLKRKQIMAERAKEVMACEATRREITVLRERVQEHLPMMANHEIELSDLVSVRAVRIGEQNLLGTRLPVLEELEVERRDYGLFSMPHWVDTLVDALIEMMTLETRLALHERRLIRFDEAVRKVTQRVNLFDKVLIPRARANIKTIKVYLSDAERAAIVRSKIAKNKRQRETTI